MSETLGYVFGFTGAAFMLASYTMKSMLPLRVAALLASCCLVVYGYVFHALPTLALYSVLIPINIRKTLQIRKLVRTIEEAKADTPLAQWLLPHMKRRTVKAGQVLWRQGDVATEMLYLESGRMRLIEHDQPLEPGALVGEIGLFAPENRRTLSLETTEDCVVHGLSAEAMMHLYFQSPKLGYHVMRLIVARLMHDTEVARARIAPAQAAA